MPLGIAVGEGEDVCDYLGAIVLRDPCAPRPQRLRDECEPDHVIETAGFAPLARCGAGRGFVTPSIDDPPPLPWLQWSPSPEGRVRNPHESWHYVG